MENINAGDVVVAGIVILFVLRKLFMLFGWDRGAFVADELREALEEARDFILVARQGGDLSNIERAVEVAAAKIKGANATDIRPLISSLITSGEDNRYGVTVKFDDDGNLSVDPSGMAGKVAHKLGKWFKKVF